MSNKNLPIAVLISGGGTTLENLIQLIAQHRLNADIKLVISSNPAARGLQIAVSAGIPTACLRRQDFSSDEAYSRAIFSRCQAADVGLVVMGGFLKFVPIPEDFENRVINIHPGLIPAFCGKGMYGHRVHQSVLDYGAKISGCTVHFVDNQYDHGPIILQRVVPVEANDTAQTLASRIFQAECDALPEAIRLFAAGSLEVSGRCVKVST